MGTVDGSELLEALEEMIGKKGHYLPNVKKGEGIEECFYGELINLGYHKRPPTKSPDFEEFEVKAVTSTDLIGRIQEGFEQHLIWLWLLLHSEKMRIRRKLLKHLKN